jgi:hypothetical protein
LHAGFAVGCAAGAFPELEHALDTAFAQLKDERVGDNQSEGQCAEFHVVTGEDAEGEGGGEARGSKRARR